MLTHSFPRFGFDPKISALFSAFMLCSAAQANAGSLPGPSGEAPEPTPETTVFQECGLELSAAAAQAYLRSRGESESEFPLGSPAPPYYVAIAAHIVRQSDGSGGLPVSQYEQAMVDANLAYSNMDIHFYTLGAIDFIDSNAFYFDIDSMAEIDALRTTNTVPNAINVYFTPNLKVSASSAICGISAFTFSDVQAIAMNNSCTATSTNHSTYAHEIGHYFDLFHTHETAFDDEFVDGSNCNTAGDLLCDTPADPTLSSFNVEIGTCSYIGEETDGHGDNYNPDTRLYMSYSRKECRDQFTPQSEAQIVTTLLGARSNLLSSAVGVVSSLDGRNLPSGLTLAAPRPNPSPGDTTVEWTQGHPSGIRVEIFDVRGRLVRALHDGIVGAGVHTLEWDGREEGKSEVAPGVYFVRVTSDRESQLQRLQIIR